MRGYFSLFNTIKVIIKAHEKLITLNHKGYFFCRENQQKIIGKKNVNMNRNINFIVKNCFSLIA